MACVFCEIISGRAPATLVHRDARTIAFLDVQQAYPGHVLIVPRAHVADIRGARRWMRGARGFARRSTRTRIGTWVCDNWVGRSRS